MALVNITKNPFSEPISVRFAETTATENGAFVAITKDKNEKERDVFKASKLAAKNLEIAVITETFHPYTALEKEEDIKIAKDGVYRAIPVKLGVEIAVAEDFVKGAVDVGDAVKPVANGHQVEKSADGADAIGYVIGKPVLNGQKSVEIRFI
jgi:hypothetical protein